MDHMAGRDKSENSPLLGFDPRTVQSVSSCYTNCAIPAHKLRYPCPQTSGYTRILEKACTVDVLCLMLNAVRCE